MLEVGSLPSVTGMGCGVIFMLCQLREFPYRLLIREADQGRKGGATFPAGRPGLGRRSA